MTLSEKPVYCQIENSDLIGGIPLVSSGKVSYNILILDFRKLHYTSPMLKLWEKYVLSFSFGKNNLDMVIKLHV